MINSTLIQRTQSAYSKGVQSDDSRLRKRHIFNKLTSSRMKLITQKLKKKQLVSQWNYQTIKCVELELAPVNECPGLPPIGCDILKSKYPIPKPLVSMSEHILQSVTSIDGLVKYDYVGWEEKTYRKGNKYTSTKPDYFIRDNYLYVTHKSGPKIVTITGLFEDPIEVYRFIEYCDTCTEGCDCESTLDYEFPIDGEQIDTLIEMSVQELIGVFNQSIEDQTNNGQDTIDAKSS